SNEELIQLQEELSGKLNKILFVDEDIAKLQHSLNKDQIALLKQAKELSVNRKNAIPSIETHVQQILAEVGMNNAQLKVEQVVKADEYFDASGLDQIKFLFTANKGHQLNELS